MVAIDTTQVFFRGLNEVLPQLLQQNDFSNDNFNDATDKLAALLLKRSAQNYFLQFASVECKFDPYWPDLLTQPLNPKVGDKVTISAVLVTSSIVSRHYSLIVNGTTLPNKDGVALLKLPRTQKWQPIHIECKLNKPVATLQMQQSSFTYYWR